MGRRMAGRRHRSRLVSHNEARRGIYLDFEGRIDAAPGDRRRRPLVEAVNAVLSLSDDERRPIITWSEHDLRILKTVSGDRPFRHRNAIRTAKRWRKAQRASEDRAAPNSLAHFEALIGYERPVEQYGVGDSLAYIVERQSASDGAIARWQVILEHNRHDLLAMRDVMLRVKE